MHNISIHNNYYINESDHLKKCFEIANFEINRLIEISKHAHKLVKNIKSKKGTVEAFMKQYNLSNNEGIMLMCLAEALLRIPDKQTMNELIQDKIGSANWKRHIGNADSLLVNVSTWALMLTGKVVSSGHENDFIASFGKIVRKSGEPVIRQALIQAVQILGNQFVMASNIKQALLTAQKENQWRYSFDMLGEAAYTAEDAENYYAAYQDAIVKIGKQTSDITNAIGISVKLSALHPRYEFTKPERLMSELYPKIHYLCCMAMERNISLCIDAEEADRLAISLQIIEKLCHSKDLSSWQGLGFAIQAYQKRALSLIDWVQKLAKASFRKLMIRLVKGAYWDFEVKHAQEMGHTDYPVFTSKVNTDVSYLACVKRLFEYSEYIYPCFATHNAHTVSYVLECAKGSDNMFEFQRLHGMGESLYEQINQPCRVYAPVGEYKDLLSYLIRRLLENGANSSFINQIHMVPISEVIKDPLLIVKGNKYMRNEKIPLPENIFGVTRKNSHGLEIDNPIVMEKVAKDIEKASEKKWKSMPIIDGVASDKNGFIESYNPASQSQVIGSVSFSTAEDAMLSLITAHNAFLEWSKVEVEARAKFLEKAADLYEEHQTRLIAILIKESGKVISDAIAEVREAVDFLRYYALQAKKTLSKWQDLPGVTGETNKIGLIGRGAFLCIAPWNFPLAIFTGQIAAALVTGNTVIAKPSEQVSIIGCEAIKLMHEAGIPTSVLQFVPGAGAVIGNALLCDNRIAGVAFTGSNNTAQIINRKLAERDGAISPLIAETGGINAMIVDASALPEQVTQHVITSAFSSAGQRCSALRVLFLQEEIADKQIQMIIGAMEELEIGNPIKLSTDVGPIIDKEALSILQKYTDEMDEKHKLLARLKLPDELEGYFFSPCIYELDSISKLKHEAFGPILHVIRYKKSDLDSVINEINNTGYGLTFSVQSRINKNIEHITKQVRVGNIYVNRNQIGAVVGSQPFGGLGLSGTGPKAGGNRYLYRFCTEQVITVDTTASGGNADLLNL